MLEPGQEPAPTQQVQYPCESCGATLRFAVGTTALRCPYCAHEQAISVGAPELVREHSFLAWVHSDDKPTGHVGAFAVRCSGCGARTETDRLSDLCPFCGAAIVVEPDAAAMIIPEAVLPFQVAQNEALASFRAWINSRWFAPNALKSLAAHEQIQGTYLPHWTFDSDATTDYTGRRGDHYYVTERYTDSEGRDQTRQVQKTRWSPAAGTVHRVFDDVLVPAVTSLSRNRLTELEPWDLGKVAPYRPEYLAGFHTLHYQVEPEPGFEQFKQTVQPVIEDDCEHDIGGDVQQVSSTRTDWGDITFKLLLLPVWLAAYRYDDRAWQVMINARTGEVVGDRPYSVWKIVFAVLLALLAVALVLGVLSLRGR
jgi:DNA-directed RNA polymerase subunit RPC12/RpoP